MMLPNPQAIELQNGNGQAPSPFKEIGTTGLDVWSGYISEAYNAKLYWPTVEPLYSRIWRSDPEVSVIRNIFDALSGQITLSWQLPEMGETETTEDDEKALAFCQTMSVDIEDGLTQWLTSCVTRVPFYGWGGWEMVAGLRKEGWEAPDDSGWTSKFDDGLVGIRNLAWRDYSSFFSWDIDEDTGRLMGMNQLDMPNQEVTIPIDRLLHITYGDHDNPEGLATLEAMWRLERIKFGLEVVMGIGFEHTAGHVMIKDTMEGRKLSGADTTALKKFARSLLTAQEGNYGILPNGFEAELMDVPFAAAATLLESIKYYGILKLTLLGMQWVALSAQTGAGSFASMKDSSSMHLLLYNNMVAGFVDQASRQITKFLFGNPINKAAFPNMTRTPILKASAIEKDLSLDELSKFAVAISEVTDLTDEDIIEIRKRSGILSETLPEVEEDETVDTGNLDADDIDTMLNGAQITASLKVANSLSEGALPARTAAVILSKLGYSEAEIKEFIDDVIAKRDEVPEPVFKPLPPDDQSPKPDEPDNIDDNELQARQVELELAQAKQENERGLLARISTGLADLRDSIMSDDDQPEPAPQPQQSFEMNMPDVHLTVPEQKEPVVNVTVPEPVVNVTVEAAPPQEPPTVNLAAPEVTVTNAPATVNVPQSPPPIVQVEVTPAEQEPPVVNITNVVNFPRRVVERTKLIYDSFKKIIGSESEATYTGNLKEDNE